MKRLCPIRLEAGGLSPNEFAFTFAGDYGPSKFSRRCTLGMSATASSFPLPAGGGAHPALDCGVGQRPSHEPDDPALRIETLIPDVPAVQSIGSPGDVLVGRSERAYKIKAQGPTGRHRRPFSRKQ